MSLLAGLVSWIGEQLHTPMVVWVIMGLLIFIAGTAGREALQQHVKKHSKKHRWGYIGFLVAVIGVAAYLWWSPGVGVLITASGLVVALRRQAWWVLGLPFRAARWLLSALWGLAARVRGAGD